MKKIATLKYFSLLLVVFLLKNYSFGQTNNCNASGTGTQLTVNSSCTTTAFNLANNSDYWDGFSGCSSGDYDDAWGYFVATATSTTITYNSTNDAILHLFGGTCSTTMTALACSDNTSSGDETITYATTIGQTYNIRIQRYLSDANMSGTICVYSASASANPDDCSSALDLSTLTAPYSNTTTGATNDFTTCGSGEDHIYYMDVPNGSTFSMNQTVNGYDSQHSMRYGGACPGTTEIDCIDDTDTDPISWQNCTGSTQRVYWIQDGYSGGDGTYTITWSLTAGSCAGVPSNDLCNGATSLPCGTSALAGTTVGSTSVADPVGCGSDYGVWYTFTGDGQSTTISSVATFDHEMVISSGSCGSHATIICEDDALSGGTESYTFISTLGVDYYVYIAHYSTSSTTTGTFTISRTCASVNTVTFDANGGSGTMNPQGSTSSTALNTNTFTQSGCYFLEWNTASDGSGTSYANGATYSFASDLTLYAQWVCGSGCLHTISLYDSWGDGWNGATIDVTVNGSSVLSNLTLSSGYGPGTYTFPADNGDAIEIVFTGASADDDECYFDLFDGYGTQLEDNYYPDTDGLTWTGSGNCDAPTPVYGQDCSLPLVLCSETFTVGNPGYSGTGAWSDFDGANDCTGGEKNSMWLQIDIASTGDLNFTIMPNDGSNNSNGAETDYDFLLWRMSGTGATTDCDGITANSSTALLACNYDGAGVTGVAPGGNAPSPINSYFDWAYESTVSVTAGDVLYLCVQNYSSSTQGFNLDFSNSGSGVVNYTSPSTIYWTAGNSTTDWTDQVNWGNCSVTPACGINAIVTGSVTDQPIIPTGDVRYVDDITINTNATLTLNGNAELHVCGDFTNNGDIVFGANSIIVFEGVGNTQTVSGLCTGTNAFGNFVINKTGGEVVLDCNIEIAGDFTTSNGTSILNTAGNDVTLGGDFNNFNGNTTYSNVGTTGTLTFNGGANQDYDQGASQLDLNHVVMNNTSTGVTLLTNMYVQGTTGTLTLTDGVITTNAFEVSVINDAPAAVYGQSTASYVIGNLRREIQSLGAYEFPVGHATKGYQNAEIEFVVATSINNLLARFDLYPGAIPIQGGTECSTTYDVENEDNGYWTIEADANGSTGNYNTTLYPTNATNTGGASGWTVTKRPSISTGSWGLNGTCAASSTAAIVMRTNMQGFSVFGVAQSTTVLPYELVEFNAKENDKTNLVYWETASELNNDYFIVYKSSDGISFEKMGIVDAAGNSNNLISYHTSDFTPHQQSFYRLGVVDFNGSEELSKIIRIDRTGQSITFVDLFPNPTDNGITVELNTNISIEVVSEIYDYAGKLVLSKTLLLEKGTNKINLELYTLAKGVYTFTLRNEELNYSVVRKLIKQ